MMTEAREGPEQEFRQHLAAGRFMIQRGVESGTFTFYPRVCLPGSGEALEWVEASGRGTVYSTTTVRGKPPLASYNVALIDLAEGPRMMSRVEGVEPSEVTIGMAVCARIVELDDGPLVVFTPGSEPA